MQVKGASQSSQLADFASDRDVYSEDCMRQITIPIGGMSCGGCVSTVRSALRALPGVRVDAVTAGSATVSYVEARTSPAAIAKAIRGAGYEPFVAAAAARSSCCGSGGGCCGG